jgi:hypothetical protein
VIRRALIVAFGLCLASPARTDEGAAALDRGVACFRAGDFAGADRELAVAHERAPADLDVTLLLGITEYRLGHIRRAEPLLRAAAASSDNETAASARIFLGLIASDEGNADAARSELAVAAAHGPGDLAESARGLLSRRGAKALELVLLVRPEFDSNVPLFPLTPIAGGPTQQADGDVLVLGAVTWRPWRRIGLSLDETASYRQQFTLTDYSMFANYLTARYDYLGRNDRVDVGYTFELMTLGGTLFTLGHVADVGYRRRIAAEFGLGLRYTFRYRDYFPDGYAPFTGPSHTGVVEASWGTRERPLEVALGYILLRETAADPTFTATGQGGRLRARARLGRRVDLAVTGWTLFRAFDVTTGGVLRRDTQLFADVSLAIDLNRHVGLIAGASVVRNLSTVADYDYLKATAHLGVAFGYAGP